MGLRDWNDKNEIKNNNWFDGQVSTPQGYWWCKLWENGRKSVKLKIEFVKILEKQKMNLSVDPHSSD